METEQSTSGPVDAQLALLLQETIHRGSNDLQMVIGLLALQSRRASSQEARQILTDATQRVSILAQARSELFRNNQPTLALALQQVCTALQSQAEPRSILVALKVEQDAVALSPTQITTIALVVNELATNAIKHAFEDGKNGYILVTQKADAEGNVIVLVDDDGLPFPDPHNPKRGGLGMEISARLMASIGGRFVRPQSRAKVFELHVSPSVSTKSGTSSQTQAAAGSDVKAPSESQNLISLHSAIRWALHLAGAQGETLTAALLEDILHLSERRQRPAVED